MFSSILNITNHKKYKIDRRNIAKQYPDTERKDSNKPLSDIHHNLAASLQNALEESMVNLAKEAYEKSGIKNFALAGGVALNCNTNSKILEQDFCEEIFIQPASNDGGAALGAALEASALEGENPDFHMIHAYWGASYSNNEIEKVLKNAKIDYSFRENIEKDAREICDSRICHTHPNSGCNGSTKITILNVILSKK